MKLKRETIEELGEILQGEFDMKLNKNDLEKFAYCLVGYFNLLQKIENRHKVQK